MPQETVSLRVVAWSEEISSYQTVDALGGTFSLGADGRIMIPVVGPIEAAGLTVAELADAVAEALQFSVRFIEEPSVSAEMVAYLPIYVVGDVGAPGAVEFRPGMTVIQALALAGGPSRATDEGPGAEREMVRSMGALREARVEIAGLRAREARLIAERDGLQAVTFPADLAHPDGANAAELLKAQETTIFEARDDALARELAAIEELKLLLTTEIETLEQKGGSLGTQLDRVRKAVGDLEGLLDQGLARAPAVLNQQRALMDLEGRDLDLETAIFRSRQSIGEAERDAIELRERRKVDAATRLQETRAAIARLEERARTAARLVIEGGGSLAELQDVEASYRYTILRDGADDIVATERTRLLGGDVVEVTMVVDQVVPSQ